MRQVAKVLMAALFATAVWTSAAHAVPVFKTCEVLLAGPIATNAIVVQLSDLAVTPAFTNTFFLGISNIANEMLAVALTAIAIDSPVRCRVDPDISPRRVLILQLKK